jgi:hypothetical protein
MDPKSRKHSDYRELAFAKYPPVCAHCGFGIRDVLEAAHIDCERSHNEVENLVILCPTCHKMLDLDLISVETILTMRDRPKEVRWGKRMKDAGAKAAKSRQLREAQERRKWHLAGLKAAETRRRNQAKISN